MPLHILLLLLQPSQFFPSMLLLTLMQWGSVIGEGLGLAVAQVSNGSQGWKWQHGSDMTGKMAMKGREGEKPMAASPILHFLAL